MQTKKLLLRSSLVLYFVIAFEVLIMISPFAGFFYSVFNPVLLKLASNPSTRWLSAFYLPHMVLPQDRLLQFVRVMGSVLFVVGMAIFIVCAGQIYYAKFTKKGAVLGGLYSFIRHPQYLALGIAGLGLSILWPRFLTIALWIVMALVYYVLAKDEERRMLNAHGATYRAYMDKTGMFLPRGLEKSLTPSSIIGKVSFALLLAAVVMGTAYPAPRLHHQPPHPLDKGAKRYRYRDSSRGRVQDGPPDGGYPRASGGEGSGCRRTKSISSISFRSTTSCRE